MKCVNPSVDEDAILFNCPFCNMDAEVDETTLAALWEADPGGKIACPPPEGCGKEYILPTLPEVSALRPKAELAAPSPPAATPAAAEPPPSTLDATGQAAPPPSTPQPEAVTPPPEAVALQPTAEPTPPSSSDLEKEVEQAVKELTDSVKKSKPAAKPKPQKPATSNGGMQMAIRTFRHGDWQGGGEDNFDEEVTRFLEETGSENVVSVTPMTYTDKDDKMIDYGVMIVFKRQAGAASAKAAAEPVVWVD